MASTESEAPTGVFLFGTDGKLYSIDAQGGISELTDEVASVHGIGIPDDLIGPDVPRPEQADVEGHDRDFCGNWHLYWKWGWIYNECGVLIYAQHYHPYNSCVAIYRR